MQGGSDGSGQVSAHEPEQDRVQYADRSGDDGEKEQDGEQGGPDFRHPAKPLGKHHEGPDRAAEAESGDQKTADEVVTVGQREAEELCHTQQIDHQAEEKEAAGEQEPGRPRSRHLHRGKGQHERRDAENKEQEGEPKGANLCLRLQSRRLLNPARADASTPFSPSR